MFDGNNLRFLSNLTPTTGAQLISRFRKMTSHYSNGSIWSISDGLLTRRVRDTLFWVVNTLFWILYASIGIAGYLIQHTVTQPQERLSVFLWILTISACGFGASCLLRFIYQRLNLHLMEIPRMIFTVLFVTFVIDNLWYFLDHLIIDRIGLLLAPTIRTAPFTIAGYIDGALWFWLMHLTWSAIYLAADQWIEWNTEKERAERAMLLAKSAQLKMLRYQLNPHFLFNTLNTIRALIDENPQQACDTISDLSEFLRYSLTSDSHRDITLKNETDALRYYFAIQKRRYEEKLDYRVEIDPQSERFSIISFIIYPLVENAIKYGMQTSPMPLKIIVSAQVRDHHLTLTVWNSGQWIEPCSGSNLQKLGGGAGLSNVRQRLENNYPTCHRFTIQQNRTGVEARIDIFPQSCK